MRPLPILTATAVGIILVLLVLQRDAVVEFAAQFGADPEAEMIETGAEIDAEATPDVEDVAEEAASPEDEPGDETEAPVVAEAEMPAEAPVEDEAPVLVAAETGSAGEDGTGEDDDRIAVVARQSVAAIVDNAVLLRGRTEASRMVEVRAETSGQVVSEPIPAGTMVTEGQPLCEIDPGTREVALAEAQAALAGARAGLPEAEAREAEARARLTEAMIEQNAAARLNEGGFASETRVASADAVVAAAEAAIESAASGVEAALSAIQSAEAAVARAELELERLVIETPFDGVIETDTAELGALLQTGAVCATIFQLDPILLVAFVPEARVDQIEVGAQAGGQLSTGERVQGEVTFIARSSDPETRTFRVEVEVRNPDLAIRDGQTADILVATEGQVAHVLPASVLTLNDAGTLGVRAVGEGDITQFLPVTMLRDTPEGVVLGGLPDEVAVIVVGQEYVSAGVPIAPSYEELTQ